jgi:hypothetical protein
MFWVVATALIRVGGSSGEQWLIVHVMILSSILFESCYTKAVNHIHTKEPSNSLPSHSFKLFVSRKPFKDLVSTLFLMNNFGKDVRSFISLRCHNGSSALLSINHVHVALSNPIATPFL